MSRRSCLSAFLLFGWASSFAWSQESASPIPGNRVRITIGEGRGGKLVGVLVRADDDAVELRVDGTTSVRRVPRLSIRALEVSAGKRSGKKTGMLIGAVGGAVAGFVDSEPCPEPEVHCPLGSHVGKRLMEAAVVGAMFGFAGKGVGSLLEKE